jgi:hypothetical protein
MVCLAMIGNPLYGEHEGRLQTKLQTNCATQHGISKTSQHRGSEIDEPGHTLTYWAAQGNMRILGRENRCTGNRTVGPNSTLSAINCSPVIVVA